MTEDWRVITETPAVLADVLDVIVPLARLRYASQRPLERRRFVLLRWADVTRRFSPDDALSVLDEELPDVVESPSVPHLTEPAVRAAALLEKGAHEEAAVLLPSMSGAGGARDLLEGRVAMQQARFSESHQHYERAWMAAKVAGGPLSPEVEVEALGHLVRLRYMRELDPAPWLQRLKRRCEELGAVFTTDAFERLDKLEQPAAKAERLARTAYSLKEHFKQKYMEPFRDDVPNLGPVPLHVHGMAKTHAEEPNTFVNAIGTMAALQWREGDRQRAYETAWYGRALGVRIFGPPIEAALDEFIEALLAPLPPERRRAFDTRLRINALGTTEA